MRCGWLDQRNSQDRQALLGTRTIRRVGPLLAIDVKSHHRRRQGASLDDKLNSLVFLALTEVLARDARAQGALAEQGIGIDRVEVRLGRGALQPSSCVVALARIDGVFSDFSHTSGPRRPSSAGHYSSQN